MRSGVRAWSDIFCGLDWWSVVVVGRKGVCFLFVFFYDGQVTFVVVVVVVLFRSFSSLVEVDTGVGLLFATTPRYRTFSQSPFSYSC